MIEQLLYIYDSVEHYCTQVIRIIDSITNSIIYIK